MPTSRAKREKRKMGNAVQYGNSVKGSRSYLAVPDGIESFRPVKGTPYTLDILSYVVSKNAKKFNDTEALRTAPPGSLWWTRKYFIHRDVGANQQLIICPAMTFGDPCPICDEKFRLKKDPKTPESTIKALFWGAREMYLVHDHADKDKDRIQLLDQSPKGFSQSLFARMERMIKKDESLRAKLANFYDPDGGYSIDVTWDDADMGDNKTWLQASVDEFTPRKKPLQDALVEHGICLDDIPQALPAKDIAKMFFMSDGSGKKSPEDEDDDSGEGDEEEETEEEEEEEGVEFKKGDEVEFKYRGKMLSGPIKKIKEGDDGPLAGVDTGEDKLRWVALDDLTLAESDPDDEEEEEEEEEEKEEEKKPARRGSGKKPPKDEDEEDDDGEEEDNDDDEEDDEEDQRKPATRSGGKRPGRKVVEEDDEEEEDEPLTDDDEEEEEEKPRKKLGKKPSRR